MTRVHRLARAFAKYWRNKALLRTAGVPTSLACLLLVTAQIKRAGGTVHYTHYDYLELAPGASRIAVDAAYARRLEQLGYGDRDGGNEHLQLLRRVHAAYEVLADPLARKAYDVKLAQEAALADAELKAALDSIAARTSKAGEAKVDTLAGADAALAA